MKQDKRLSEVSESLYEEIDSEVRCQDVITLFVMAPVMYCYVKWVLREALKAGHRTLYFLARDGYSMYRVAKVICTLEKLPITCRYLYCSRYSLRSAQYALLGQDSLDYICLGGIDVTFERLMCRAGLNREEAVMIAGQLGYAEQMQVPLSYAKVKAMKSGLLACPDFMDLLMKHAKENYPLVCGYLAQEGLLQSEPYAVVDSGWTGSMQKSIRQLLSGMGYEKRIEGYYFGMYEYPEMTDRADYHCYYFEPKKKIRRKVYFSNCLFECIFSSPEGMTLGYRQEKDRYIPVLEKPENPNKTAIEHSTQKLCAFAERMIAVFQEDVRIPEDGRKTITEQLLKCFMGHPLREEAEVYGSYIFCDDVRGEEQQTVAAKMSYQELKENRPVRKGINMLLQNGKPVKESAWPEGSTVLIEEAGNNDLRRCALYKYALYLRKLTK